ncbi:MAG: glutamine--fructose-6-phosphate transaminase (isomerizing) [Alphaproteobacteria bacterium]|nr:glutamine--fructose-6-phosphate transaminase (isomerizing) [Alphaproteobacteria bacterium]MDD9919471.1 glutamine--fructose-6-phosphate transaminase (isomerizing) [Alphaproteobacteria bacterium]
MCGIVGVVGSDTAIQDVLTGLKKLEYRGYDSSGISTVYNGQIDVRKEKGKIAALEALMQTSPFTSNINIAMGHTRWATHGEPSQKNAHPHLAGQVAVVHNGIIENFQELREELLAKGVELQSETDTETVSALINTLVEQGKEPLTAVQEAIQKLEGAFALSIQFAGHDNMLIATRRGAPLCIGLAEGKTYLGSDPIALADYTNRFIFLEDDDIAVITPEKASVCRPNGAQIERLPQIMDVSSVAAGKAGYRHFMLKEINEQPGIISTLLEAYLDSSTGDITLPNMNCDISKATQINIVACGTAFIAGQIGKYYFEQLAGVPVNVDVASEFRYRKPPYVQGGVFIAISQSGETADTLAALEDAKANGQHIIAITNTPTSSIARAADTVVELMAGPEIAVASTKAFTAMVLVMALLALKAAQQKGLDKTELAQYIQGLKELPSKLTQAIAMEGELHTLAQDLMHATSMLYLGRGALQPLAFEGALKMKEISYIHAEGYASGEMKHGPIALVDENLPVVNMATTTDGLFDKTVSNMKEIEARRGQVILFTDAEGVKKLDKDIAAKARVYTLPMADTLTTPIIYTIPLQLLAYHVAVEKGTDVDQPRNLAKSVTVE